MADRTMKSDPSSANRFGVIRTQELLAGRRIDGAHRQFFTRAVDFGYSKSMDETLRIWDRQAVLGDVVHASSAPSGPM